ncbi:MAG TPA: hypothetical protein VIU61_18705 [Kofleriaceae bacterium]
MSLRFARLLMTGSVACSIATSIVTSVACSIDPKHYATDASAPDGGPHGGTDGSSSTDGRPGGDASPSTRPRVAYAGDGIAHETAAVVRYELTIDGAADFIAATKPRLALCDFFPETIETERTKDTPVPALDELVRTTRPEIVVLQFWGNSDNHNPCMKDGDGEILEPGTLGYYARYRADAVRATQIIRDAAAAAGGPIPTIFWVLQGPDRELPERPMRLDDNVRAVADQSAASHTIDAGRGVSEAANPAAPGGRYEWTQWLPCNDFEIDSGHCATGSSQIHKDDKTPEFCLGKVVAGECDKWSPGVFRYGRAIAEAVRAAL